MSPAVHANDVTKNCQNICYITLVVVIVFFKFS